VNLVYVRWQDAIHPQGAWEHTKDIEREPDCLTETVGWLVHQTPKVVQVAVTISGRGKDDEQYTGIMVIPMGCVDSIETIAFAGSKARTLYRKPRA
jgi:hypothetical protein